MKKCSMYLVALILGLFLTVLSSPVSAEPYQSEVFPSDDIIEKFYESRNRRFKGKFLGKHEESKDSYVLYIRYAGRTSGVESVTLIKLDTGLWVYDGKRILEKF